MKKYAQQYLFLFFLLFIFTQIGMTQTVWIGGATGNWNTATNWNTGAVPTATDDVQFTTDATVALDINVTIKSLEVQGVSGTDVVINSAGGTNLTIDGSDVNSAGLRLDEGNFELGLGINLTIRNNLNNGIVVDNMDTLINHGTIYIEDFEATLGENDDGVLINNSSLFINNGLLTIDDLFIEGGNNGYMFQVANGSTFINSIGATYQAVTPAMTANVIHRDGLVISGSTVTASVINDGTITIGTGDNTRIQRHGIYNLNGSFTNNGTITVNGTLNYGIINDNAGADFTNNGIIDIDNTDDGILNTNDADVFTNNSQILIGNGNDLLIDDYGIRNQSVFHNYAEITINGTNDQGIYSSGVDANFINHSTGIITIDNVSADQILNGDGTNGGFFTNDGGLININQNSTITGGNAAVLNNDFANLINQNGGIINIDFVPNEAVRSDAITPNALVNTGVGSTINVGSMQMNTIGDGGNFDDAVYANGDIRNENGATLNIFEGTGRGIHLTTLGNFINDNGLVNIDNVLEHAISNATEDGRKFTSTGANAIINIGQNTSNGTGQTDDNAIRCDGTFENLNGSTINIDNVLGGYAIDLGADSSTDPDTLINSGTINISQNSGFIDRDYNIRVRDTCVLHNLVGGEINISNVQSYAIHFLPETEFVNNGTINITDYEQTAGGFDNAIYLKDAKLWSNDGTIRINDPANSGYFFSHAMYIENTPVTMGANSNIIIADPSMTTGYIGGSGLYFNNCTVDNAGAITIGNGATNRLQANGIHFINTDYTSAPTSSITINGLPVNTNGILLSSGSFSNAGTIDIDNVHRGINASSSSTFFNNSGNITIGDGMTNNVKSIGLFNQTALTNTGTITTNGTTSDGIRSAHPNASFANSGTITIDNSNANGFTNGFGSASPSPLTNNGGTINIGLNGAVSNIPNIGLFIDDAGSLTNTNGGIITIANTGINTLQNEASGANQLLNTVCSIIDINGNFNNSGVFNNEAILLLNGGVYTHSNDLNNTGYIQDNNEMLVVNDRNMGTIDGINNMGTVINKITMLCPTADPTDVIISESTDISTNNFTTSNTWYFDANLTMTAGTFDAFTNTFTYTNPPTANTSDVLYFNINGAGGCSYTGNITIDIQDDSSCDSCPMNASITGFPANNEVISVQNGITTTGVVVIQNTKTVILKAGVQICLEADFEVELGADFEAKIEACTPLTAPKIE